MTGLPIKSWQVEFEDYRLECLWFPGRWMSPAQTNRLCASIDEANELHKPLSYGFFADKRDQLRRTLFLSQSVWCVIYKSGKACGFVYQFHIGRTELGEVMHFGLVKLSHRPGRDFIRVPYVALGLGNLINFGPHYATNISHVPAIIDMFGDMTHSLFPAFAEQDINLRQNYRPILALLRDKYVVPVLGYDPKTIDEKTYKIVGSLAEGGGGFETDWKAVPKSQSTLCNLFVREWLGVHENEDGSLRIKDDLIQIGQVDFSWLSNPKLLIPSNQMRFRTWDEESQTEQVQLPNLLMKGA